MESNIRLLTEKKNYVKGTLFNRKDVIYGVTHPGF